jgi:hypothetical protein
MSQKIMTESIQPYLKGDLERAKLTDKGTRGEIEITIKDRKGNIIQRINEPNGNTRCSV